MSEDQKGIGGQGGDSQAKKKNKSVKQMLRQIKRNDDELDRIRLEQLAQQQKLEKRKATVAWERQKDGDTKNGFTDTEGNGGAEDTINAIAESSEEDEAGSENGTIESKRDDTKTAGMMKNTKFHIQEEQNRSFYD